MWQFVIHWNITGEIYNMNHWFDDKNMSEDKNYFLRVQSLTDVWSDLGLNII